MSDTPGGEPASRRRGRHVAPPAATSAEARPSALPLRLVRAAVARVPRGARPDRLRLRLASAAAGLQPRVAGAAAWVRERRLRVFIVGSGVALAALLGGTVALLQPTTPLDGPDDAAPAVSPSRPTADDPAEPSTLETDAPATDAPRSEAPPVEPDGEAPTPGSSAPEPTPEPTAAPETEPEPTAEPDPTGNGRDTAPGQTKKPPKPAG